MSYGQLKYVVATYEANGTGEPTITKFGAPDEAAELFLRLVSEDKRAPRDSGQRLLVALLKGSRTFSVIGTNQYIIHAE